MSVLLSIIVPVYKIDEKLLGDCLSSLKRQKFQSVEFIVIDDGSPDNCGNICDTYGREDSRFKIIHTENLGVSNARNVGIESASGDYVVFVDGDDFVEDDLCEVLGNVAIANNDDIIFFYHVTTNNPRSTEIADGGIYSLSKEKIGELKKDIIEQRDTVPGVWIGPPWGKMYRRSIILDNNLRFVVGLRKSQDRVFVFDYLNNIK